MEIKDLRPGDWFEICFGYERRRFYVVANSGDRIIFCSGSWLTGANEVLTYEFLLDHALHGDILYYGRGSRRWWWRFVPFRSLVMPFTHPPADFMPIVLNHEPESSWPSLIEAEVVG